MANPKRIAPDLSFVSEIQALGGDTVKRCYQCATCSVACPLSPAENPYPRKEMVWAQWGMKDRLLTDMDVWLCHNCGTCSDLCPRGAKPGDLLAALRNMAYRQLTTPSIVGKWMSSPRYLPILIGIPALLFLIVWALTTGLTIPDGKIVYGKVFPGDYTIDPIFSLAFFFVVYTFYTGVKKLLAGFKTAPKTFYLGDYKTPSMCESLISVLKDEVATHKKWKDCGETTEADEQKFQGHFSLMWAFVALLVVTSIVAMGHWGGKLIEFIEPMGHTPMHLLNPVKILANVGAVALIFGLVKLTKRRLAQDEATTTSSYHDWYLLGVIWAVGVTGILAELIRLAGIAWLAYPVYYTHLVTVFMLIAYLPWSKLGHLVYRTAALTYARHVGRLPLTPRQEATFNVK